jgi:hypothetical protein
LFLKILCFFAKISLEDFLSLTYCVLKFYVVILLINTNKTACNCSGEIRATGSAFPEEAISAII